MFTCPETAEGTELLNLLQCIISEYSETYVWIVHGLCPEKQVIVDYNISVVSDNPCIAACERAGLATSLKEA
jgi:hypothetical protein